MPPLADPNLDIYVLLDAGLMAGTTTHRSADLQVGRHIGVAVQDTSLLGATRTWRFNPATENGRPVKYRLRYPIGVGDR